MLLVVGLVVLLPLVVAIAWLAWVLSASRPTESGHVAVTGLTAPVTVARDRLGVPTVSGASREEVALATGFVHAQERFFQMDLFRRHADGSLAALLGPATLSTDRSARRYGLRAVAEQVAEGARYIGGSRHDDLLQDYPVRVLTISSEPHRELFGMAQWAYEDGPFETVQLVYPDKQGRWPWTEGIGQGFRRNQPVIGDRE